MGRCVSVKSKGHYEDGNCSEEDFKENKAQKRSTKAISNGFPGAQADCVAQNTANTKTRAAPNSTKRTAKPKASTKKPAAANSRAKAGPACCGACRLRMRKTGANENVALPRAQWPRKRLWPWCKGSQGGMRI